MADKLGDKLRGKGDRLERERKARQQDQAVRASQTDEDIRSARRAHMAKHRKMTASERKASEKINAERERMEKAEAEAGFEGADDDDETLDLDDDDEQPGTGSARGDDGDVDDQEDGDNAIEGDDGAAGGGEGGDIKSVADLNKLNDGQLAALHKQHVGRDPHPQMRRGKVITAILDATKKD